MSSNIGKDNASVFDSSVTEGEHEAVAFEYQGIKLSSHVLDGCNAVSLIR